jgi:hypothetical protein
VPSISAHKSRSGGEGSYLPPNRNRHIPYRYLTGLYLTGMYLIHVHLMGVYLIGMYLRGVYLIGTYLLGVRLTSVSVKPQERKDGRVQLMSRLNLWRKGSLHTRKLGVA